MMPRGLICKFVWYALPSKNDIERRVVGEGRKIRQGIWLVLEIDVKIHAPSSKVKAREISKMYCGARSSSIFLSSPLLPSNSPHFVCLQPVWM